MNPRYHPNIPSIPLSALATLICIPLLFSSLHHEPAYQYHMHPDTTYACFPFISTCSNTPHSFALVSRTSIPSPPVSVRSFISGFLNSFRSLVDSPFSFPFSFFHPSSLFAPMYCRTTPLSLYPSFLIDALLVQPVKACSFYRVGMSMRRCVHIALLSIHRHL
jgi:hypothetical protein